MPDDLHRHRAVPPACPAARGGADLPARGEAQRPGAGTGDAAGAALAALVEQTRTSGLDRLDDLDLVDLIAAAHRVEAWAHAQTAHLVGALAHRPSMNPDWSSSAHPTPERGCVADEEVAMRLGLTRQAARTLVREGVAYTGSLAATGDALAAGHLDAPRARILVDRLAEEDTEVAQLVEAEVLPGAGRRTTSQLRRDIERALVRLDPEYADGAHRLARTRRRVDHPRMLPDGMASIQCVLPATDAARVDIVLDTCARSARAHGDPRTHAQLRADGLRDLVTGEPWWTRQAGPGGADGASVGLPATDRGTTKDVGVAPEDGADICDGAVLDDGVSPDGDAAVHRDGLGLADGVGGGHRPRSVVRTVVHVTVPLSTVLGLDDQPAELHGYGAITAGTARGLATEVGAVWRRIVTDPLSGTVLDVGRTRYRPPAGLADHVRARDRWCVRPGCSTPAERCDLDHTVEYHDPPDGSPPGTTSHDNLGPLCGRDHRLKTEAGFVLRQIEPGVFEWTTPAGHRYRVRPGADQTV